MSYRIASVTIEGMHNVLQPKEVYFDNLTYLYGPNGAGKSTILTAIQWALLGYIPGTDKRVSAIWEHANPNARRMSVDLVIESITTKKDGLATMGDNSITIHRELYPQGKSIQTQFYTTPADFAVELLVKDLELPIFNFSEFLNLSKNGMKDWFLKFLPAATDDFDFMQNIIVGELENMPIIDDKFVDEMSETYAKLWEGTPKGIEGLRIMNERIKSDISFKKGEVTRLLGTIQSLVKYEDVDTSVDVDALTAKRTEKTDEVKVLLELKHKIVANDAAKKRLSDFLAIAGPVAVNVDELQDKLDSLKSKYTKTQTEIFKIRDEMNPHVAEANMLKNSASSAVCPYTKKECETAKSVANEIEAKLKEHEAALSILSEKEENLNTMLNEISQDIRIIETKINDYNGWHSTQAAYRAAIDESEELNQDANEIMTKVLRLEEEVKSIDDQIVKVKANQKYEELNAKLTEDKIKADENLDVLKRWEKATGVSGYQTQMADAPLKQLEANITKYLQILFKDEDITANFVLEAKSNTFEFGMMKNNIRRSFKMLSSGEKCMYTLALFMALAFDTDTDLPVLLIDDMLDHLDDSKITGFFTALEELSDVDKQLIIAGVQKCDEPRCTVRII